MRASIAGFIVCLTVVSAQGKYGGGSGTKEDPYQIWTAEQLNIIGTERADWNKHFKLMADIDLAALGSTSFNVIGIRPLYGRPFSGTFDGNGHTIANLTCIRSSAMSLGLFGGVQGANAVIEKLILKDVRIDAGTGGFVGALVGDLQAGQISRCYVDGGSLSGSSFVGGLVGYSNGSIAKCSSSASVLASSSQGGGLVGRNETGGTVTGCCATGQVSSVSTAGGLVAENAGTITDCYSTSSTTSTQDYAGGFVGSDSGIISRCYSTGGVSAPTVVGGLVAAITGAGSVTDSFWDVQTSGESTSAGGSGKSTAQMQTAATFASWDFVDTWVIQEGLDYPRLQWEANRFPTPVPTTVETVSGDFQCALAGSRLPRLLTVRVKDQDGQVMANVQVQFVVVAGDGTVEPASGVTDIGGLASAELTLGVAAGLNEVRAIVGDLFVSLNAAGLAPGYAGGEGSDDDPYQIRTAEQMYVIAAEPNDWDKHFRLMADLDLSKLHGIEGRWVFNTIAPGEGLGEDSPAGPPFTGVLDGNDHTISHVIVMGGRYSGVFGQLAENAEVKSLGIADAHVAGSLTGALAGENRGAVTDCHCAGTVSGWRSGGLLGANYGDVTQCYAACAVSGDDYTGGLVGENDGLVSECYSTGKVTGMFFGIGGLVGFNIGGTVTQCYSTGDASGKEMIGGLVGWNSWGATVSYCYSTGVPTGDTALGGLVGNDTGAVTQSYWDTQTSGKTWSSGGTGKTTVQMKTASTFAGWNFVGTWIIDEGLDYPRLRMQGKYGGGSGTAADPYQIWTAEQMNAIGANQRDWDNNFKLMADIDLSAFDGKNGRPAYNLIGPDTDPSTWYYDQYAIPFTGTFDGNGHTISHLTIAGRDHIGLFCYLDPNAVVKDLGVLDVNITGVGRAVGGLAGYTRGALVTRCYSTGVVSSTGTAVGGLVGYNRGYLTHCCSEVRVHGTGYSVGGLTGESWGPVTGCHASGPVSGAGTWVGGLVGGNYSTITQCYSTGAVRGSSDVGGLVGLSSGLGGRGNGVDPVADSFWNIETSGQAASAGGMGKTTAEMQTGGTFLKAGWDFVGETANGTEDVWWIDEGKDYPRLWWEALDIDDR